MTTAGSPQSNPQDGPPSGQREPDRSALAAEDHQRGLVEVAAQVHALQRPSSMLLRVVLDIGTAAADPTWAQPNVAVRVNFVDDEPVSRVYTVRDADLAARQVSIDVVQHGAPSPMMRWSERIGVGDEVRLVGPRPHFRVPETADPALLFADDSAIPALYEILRAWPQDRAGTVFVASDDDAAVAELDDGPAVQITRLAAGTDALIRAAISVEQAQSYVVWAAGERDEMKLLRRHFRNEVGLGKDQVAIFGYWKRGTSSAEIDKVRLATYNELLAAGKTIADLDDLSLSI